MKKNNSIFSHILNILLIIIISYIACTASGYTTIIFVISSATIAFLLYMSKGNAVNIYSLCGIISYVFFYMTNTEFSVNMLLNMGISILDLYLPAICLYLCFSKKATTLSKCVKWTCCANLFVLILSLAKIRFFDNINITDETDKVFSQFIGQYKDLLSANANIVNMDTNDLTSFLTMTKDALIMMMPSLFILSSLCISFVISFISTSLVNTSKNGYRINNKLSEIYFGKNLNIITLILLLASLFIRHSYINAGLYNFFIVVVALYFTDGVAVLNYFIRKKTKNTFLTSFLTVFILIFAIFSIFAMPAINGITILFFVGMFDSTHDFRKIRGAKI